MLDGCKLKCINSNSGDNVSIMWSLYTEDGDSGSQKKNRQKCSRPRDVQGQEIGGSERSTVSQWEKDGVLCLDISQQHMNSSIWDPSKITSEDRVIHSRWLHSINRYFHWNCLGASAQQNIFMPPSTLLKCLIPCKVEVSHILFY